ncbi:hypothetical protein BDW62DRAFT_15873 [Aspergillus aurantiobrunneus]
MRENPRRTGYSFETRYKTRQRTFVVASVTPLVFFFNPAFAPPSLFSICSFTSTRVSQASHQFRVVSVPNPQEIGKLHHDLAVQAPPAYKGQYNVKRICRNRGWGAPRSQPPLILSRPTSLIGSHVPRKGTELLLHCFLWIQAKHPLRKRRFHSPLPIFSSLASCLGDQWPGIA